MSFRKYLSRIKTLSSVNVTHVSNKVKIKDKKMYKSGSPIPL